MWRTSWLEPLIQDLRYALRTLVGDPRFGSVAALTLALGIGATTALFSVVNAVLLAPLPYPQAGRLVMVWGINRGYRTAVSGGAFADWKTSNRVFDSMSVFMIMPRTLTGAGNPRYVTSYRTSGEFFRLLGVMPRLGRVFGTEDDRAGGPKVAVLSDGLWRTSFHADPGLVGKTITLDGSPYTVIGVMPASFRLPPPAELWTPLALEPAALADYQRASFAVLARLKPGATLDRAQAEMEGLERRIALRHLDTDAGKSIQLVPLREQLAGDIRTPLLVLTGAAGFVLLIACANVANLLLVRAAARRPEMAVRAALGASGGRLLRQSLAEATLLSFVGGGLGLALAFGVKGLLLAIFPQDIANLSIPTVTSIPLDRRVCGFAVGLTCLAVVVFGAVPTLHRSRLDAAALREGGRGASSSRRAHRVRGALVVAEVSLALVLLAGAGLMIKTFRNLSRSDLGFRPDHVLMAQVSLSEDKYPYAQRQKRWAFIEEVIARARALPGVRSAGAVSALPLSGMGDTQAFTVEGQFPSPSAPQPAAESFMVAPGYFSTLGIRVEAGREFTAADRKGAPLVVIVSRTVARRLWGGQDPLGRRLNFGDPRKPLWWTVVGVVGDVKSTGITMDADGDVYRPLAQIPYSIMTFVVRTAGEPASLTSALERTIWSVDKDQPIVKTVTLQHLADESLVLRRISMLLLAAFSVTAMLLAAVGIYGVMASAIVQRTHEIGVRIALGARRTQVLATVMAQGLRMAFLGITLGLAGALSLTGLLSNLLYGVSPTDAATLALASLLLGGVALAAGYIPARNATSIDPIIALRHD